jgi:hypothetical protein
MTDYTFFKEIESFNLDHYNAYIGWIGNKSIKICTDENFERFYLYDEVFDKLFEISADSRKLKSSEEYDKAILAYHNSHLRFCDTYYWQ